MAYEFETIAKEITLSVLSKTMITGESFEKIGTQAGQIYRAILKEVTEAHKEISSTPGTSKPAIY
jgi:hypothetical protein